MPSRFELAKRMPLGNKKCVTHISFELLRLTESSNYDYAVPELSSAPLLMKRRFDTMSDRVTDIVGDRMDIEARMSVPGSLRSKHSTQVNIRVITRWRSVQFCC